jgi:radical SAM superfamily enzyme YgiQ (UPF0313 family)
MVRKRKTQGKSFAQMEIGAIRKSGKARVKIALVYPNRYHVGMSNLGFQTAYALFNAPPDVTCERVFLPEPGDPPGTGVTTIESKSRISEFDIVAFSISYENDYPNLLTILERGGFPLRSAQRTIPHPLVVAGGVACFLNPEPIAPFIDCILIGEAEELIAPFLQCVSDADLNTESARETLLMRIAQKVPGAYVPNFYEAAYRADGTLGDFKPTMDVPSKIRRVFSKDLSSHPTCSSILTPEAALGHTFLIEVGRGCTHGCRFCATGYVYRPPRFRTRQAFEKMVDRGESVTDKIGIVGAAISDHPDIEHLCLYAIQKHLHVGFSSLRADSLGSALLGVLKKNKTQTVTIAPDAGSERMRSVINKGMNESDILNAAKVLIESGILNLKLYFMVGLPTETIEDVEAIITLCKRIKHQFLKSSKAKGRIGTITVSLSSFVPKPFTPFQWAAMESVRSLKEKIRKVKESLNKIPNIRVHADIPRWAFLQGVFALGDRRVADMLVAAHNNHGNWAKTLKESLINPSFYVYRDRPLDELLPWDFIDHGIRKSFLASEYRRALAGVPSPPCPIESCRICGVC